MRIYIANMNTYNKGILDGAWLDLPCDDVQESLFDIVGNDEYAIHDYEGFGDMKISEYADIETLNEFAQLFENHYEVELIIDLLTIVKSDNLLSYDMEELEDDIDEMIFYHNENTWNIEKDFAYDYLEENGYLEKMPNFLTGCIDFQHVFNELSHDFYYAVGNNVLIYKYC